MIELCNLRNSKPVMAWEVCCDRRSPLGNKFYMSNETYRDLVCNQYAEWFEMEVLTGRDVRAYAELMRLAELNAKWGQLRLFCWCVPKRCHTSTIKYWLDTNVPRETEEVNHG